MRVQRRKRMSKLWLVVVRVTPKGDSEDDSHDIDVRPYQQPMVLAKAQAEVSAHAAQAATGGGDAMGYLMARRLPDKELTQAFAEGGLAEHPDTKAVVHREDSDAGGRSE